MLSDTPVPCTKNVRHKQLGNILTIEKSATNLELVLLQKVNTTGTDETLFRLVPVLGHGARAWAPCLGSKPEQSLSCNNGLSKLK